MKWKAIKVMNTDSVFDWWNKSDPYLKFLKLRQDNSLVMASQTEVVPNSLSPSWNTIEIPVTRLASGKDQKFKYYLTYSEFNAGIVSLKERIISS